jgi:hypothetical protein
MLGSPPAGPVSLTGVVKVLAAEALATGANAAAAAVRNPASAIRNCIRLPPTDPKT